MKSILLLTFITFSIVVNAQIHVVGDEKIYDKFYFIDYDKCFTFNENPDTISLDQFDIHNQYLNLQILNIKTNLDYFFRDNEGVFLPYSAIDLPDAKPLGIITHATDKAFETNTIPYYMIDTIQIIRNKPSAIWTKSKDKNDRLIHNLKETNIDFVQLSLLKQTYIESAESNDQIIEVQIEFKEGDFISNNYKNEIVCPDKIDSNLNKLINKSLISYGYLDDKKRTKFIPEIKNALLKLQADFFIQQGFLDKATMSLLGLEFPK